MVSVSFVITVFVHLINEFLARMLEFSTLAILVVVKLISKKDTV